MRLSYQATFQACSETNGNYGMAAVKEYVLFQQTLAKYPPSENLWFSLQKELGKKLNNNIVFLQLPQYGGPFEDGIYQFVWNYDKHHLEIDLLSDNSLEWFYLNRENKETNGGNCAINTFSYDLLNYCLLFQTGWSNL
jgi:hypothetical protein